MAHHYCQKRGRHRNQLHYCKACLWHLRRQEPIASAACSFLASQVPAARDLIEQSFQLNDAGRCKYRLHH